MKKNFKFTPCLVKIPIMDSRNSIIFSANGMQFEEVLKIQVDKIEQGKTRSQQMWTMEDFEDKLVMMRDQLA